MTGIEIVNISLDLLNYPSFEKSGIDISRAKNVVNAVYSDLFYMNNENGFKRLNGLEEEIPIDERVLNDIMPYGVAAFLAESMNDGDNQQLFMHKYNQKRLSLSQKSTIRDTLPTPD